MINIDCIKNARVYREISDRKNAVSLKSNRKKREGDLIKCQFE